MAWANESNKSLQNRYLDKKNTLILPNSALTLSSELSTFNDLVDLINMTSKFFGPAFLTTFSSIFIIITVQLYYSYLILSNFDEKYFRSWWTFGITLNNVINHMLLVFVISTISEKIYTQVKLIQGYYYKVLRCHIPVRS